MGRSSSYDLLTRNFVKVCNKILFDILGIDEFLDAVTVLPPGEWDHDQCVCLLFCESGSAHTSVAISRQIPTRQKGECEFSAATKNFVKHQGWPQL